MPQRIRPRRTSEIHTLRLDNNPASETERASLILKHAHDSSVAFLRAFDVIRKRRPGGRKGGTTDEEQDLLRAMLVTAAAGLDSMTKQLIRDALPTLVDRESKARDELEKFTNRQLREGEDDSINNRVRSFLARVLIADSTRGQLVREFVRHLTSSSLQSADELIRAGNALGLSSVEVKFDPQKLKEIFDKRNQIIHDLDINFGAGRRNRFIRTRPQMIADTNFLLAAAQDILNSVQKKLEAFP